MPFSTEAELKTAVQSWLDRSDYSAVADDMIVLAEGHFNMNLKTREMVEQVSLTPSSGVCTLPSDFLGAIRVVGESTPRRILTQMGSNIVDKKHDSSIGGSPATYTIIGDELHTFPQSNVDIELTYWEKIPPLASNTSNWLLTKYPNLYLEACMMEAHRYFPNSGDLQLSTARVAQMIDSLNSQSMVEELADATKVSYDYSP